MPDNLTPAGAILKTATRVLFKEGFSSPEYAVDHCRVGRSVLFDYANPAKVDLFMPLDVAAGLQQACGQYPITQALARLSEGYFVRPAPGAKVRVNFGAVMPSVGRDIGELLKNAYAAVEDGKFTAQEIAQLRIDIERTISDLCLARGVLDGAAP